MPRFEPVEELFKGRHEYLRKRNCLQITAIGDIALENLKSLFDALRPSQSLSI
jgi:hypothetical protein